MRFIYYSAAWCAPCKRVWPWVDAVAEEFGARVDRVDIDHGPVEGVMSVPTLDIVVNGELLKRIVRWSSARALAREVEEVMG